MQFDYDIVIAGGGMVGASFACALGNSALRCCIIEPVHWRNNRRQSTYDDRGLSLSRLSCQILTRLGVWPHLNAASCPIQSIHISNQGQFGIVRLSAAETGLSELGRVVSARDLGNAVYARVNECNTIDTICPARVSTFEMQQDAVVIQLDSANNRSEIRCRLLVAADGSHSSIRKQAGIAIESHDYQQTALTAAITTQQPNHNTAFERFTPHGPIAVLPRDTHQSSLVFTVESEQANAYQHRSDKAWIARIESEFGRRLGKITGLDRGRSYPIKYSAARQPGRHRLLLLGNAAHSLHPNAGQGFNLGLRAAATLADTLLNHVQSGGGLGALEPMLTEWQRRSTEQKRVIQFTRTLASLFYSDALAKRILRNQCMLLLAHNACARRRLIHCLTGLHGTQPALSTTAP